MVYKCDIDDLKNTLFGAYSNKVHQIEIIVDYDMKKAFLGRPIETIYDEIDFWHKANYDYITITIPAFGVSGNKGNSSIQIMQEKEFSYSKYSNSTKRNWAREDKGVVLNDEDFENFPWFDPSVIDFSPYIKAKSNLPKNMGIIGIVPRLFLAVWTLMGFNHFSYMTVDQPDFIKRMFLKVGEIQYQVFYRLCDELDVDAMWIGDDIATGTGLMASPQFLREHLFPWYKKMGNICKKKEIPFIFHSDGNLTEVIDDLIDCGFNALHPIEPKVMDAIKVKGKYGNKICILGNIELDILSRGTKESVRDLTLSRLKDLWNHGGYCPGSSNSVTDYVPLENYIAMLDAIQNFREKL